MGKYWFWYLLGGAAIVIAIVWIVTGNKTKENVEMDTERKF